LRGAPVGATSTENCLGLWLTAFLAAGRLLTKRALRDVSKVKQKTVSQ
jgi:hypothetical protein